MKTGAVTAIGQPKEGFIICGGYESGHLLIWDATSSALLKSLLVHESPVLAIHFYNDDKMRFLSSDAKGGVLKVYINRSLWSYGAEHERILMTNTRPIYMIDSITLMK